MRRVRECDKCGSRIRDTKYPWYSYYAPNGEVAEGVLWRYCSDCKRDIQKLYAVHGDFFGRAKGAAEEADNTKEYNRSLDCVREAIRKGELS